MTEFVKKSQAQIATELMAFVMADDIRGARELLKRHDDIARTLVNTSLGGKTMMAEARGIPMQALLMRYEGRPVLCGVGCGIPDMSVALYYDKRDMPVMVGGY